MKVLWLQGAGCGGCTQSLLCHEPGSLVAELREQILSLPNVSGLALDVTTKPPGTIEWE